MSAFVQIINNIAYVENREYEAAISRVRKLEEALHFYADPENWGNDDWGVRAIIQPPDYGDAGKIARNALAGFESDADSAK